ncbi:uncharacterized protein LOC143149470 isoform X3 [Ptiloglossa arizonensis]|uniref:uncharacterized protein LOC143149470 isoform X3 n=1 Tax=Ptiloglossa arizonensis TaxID=3350558 RepID=UPI003F9EF366
MSSSTDDRMPNMTIRSGSTQLLSSWHLIAVLNRRWKRSVRPGRLPPNDPFWQVRQRSFYANGARRKLACDNCPRH